MVVDEKSGDKTDKSWNCDLRNLHFPSMVVIKDVYLPNLTGDLSIFPPINHENLQRSSSSSATTSSSDSDHSEPDSPPKSAEKRGKLSIFPPTNHENLRSFSSPLSLSATSSSSEASLSSFSPSESDQSDSDSPADSPPKKRATFRGSHWWLEIGVEALRLRALRLASLFGVRGSWGFGGVLAAMVVTVCTLWIGARQQRRIHGLVSVINERDEKINKLLLQIAQLNEVLIARHRTLVSKVPS